jgi:hypothetical protein
VRVLLDTSALNWLTDTPTQADVFFAAKAAARFDALVVPEAAWEIRKTADPVRRANLEVTLARFFPLTATRVPRLGSTAILGLMRLPTADDERRLQEVSFLRDGPDRDLAVNAAGYRAEFFLTCDTEMNTQKLARLEAALQGTRVVHPAQFLAELDQSRLPGETM